MYKVKIGTAKLFMSKKEEGWSARIVAGNKSGGVGLPEILFSNSMLGCIFFRVNIKR